ncbi:MAG: alkaline phosphatase family protein, partial [Chloroflexi bacterium]|nr:alkaline phosphatase family protein [Chloroflexota bacterium]
RSIRSSTMWDVAAKLGNTVGLLNLPMTYPVPEVNGYAIAGMLSVRRDATFAYPSELLELVESMGSYVVDIEPATYIERGAIGEMLRDLVAMTRRRIDLAISLIESYPTDVFMTVFVTPDRIQHTLWHLLDPSHPLHNAKEGAALVSQIDQCYATVDEGIGRLISAAGPSAATIVMSDHGFGPLIRHLDIEAWLRETGMLKYRQGTRPARRALELAHAETLVWKGLGLLRGSRKAPLGLAQIKELLIDWPATKAFRGDAEGYSLYMNMRGREPWGLLEPGPEYDETRQTILQGLKALIDPDDGASVVDTACLAEEVYRGPFTYEAPDLLLTLRSGYKAGRQFYASRIFWPAQRDRWGTGCHRREGIVALAGPAVASTDKGLSASIMDVAPTVLYLLGAPIPDDIDGKIIADALQPGMLAARQPETAPASEIAVIRPGGHVYSEQEEQEVNQRLRNLGYLD